MEGMSAQKKPVSPCFILAANPLVAWLLTDWWL
jgi:hypothetical protein